MSQNRIASAVVALALAPVFVVGCGSPTNDPRADADDRTRVEVRTNPNPTNPEIPGTTAPGDLNPVRAQMWLDDVRVGTHLGVDGVTEGRDTFAGQDDIHVSMRVNDAPAGAVVRLVVLDENDVQVWTNQQAVKDGDRHMHFTLGDLPGGEYDVRVMVGDESVADRTITIGA
jgi:hypothetical protein